MYEIGPVQTSNAAKGGLDEYTNKCLFGKTYLHLGNDAINNTWTEIWAD
ncbi:MAG: hypothetical protein ETSY1_42585 [Candidatus Entotheonella factor]|uniref:Uncharacterized protein n=1 Tax=Entotheonella factor TaxID=1429438 RepID=W4L3L4_ENTF1|nr:MAG: hypothetical protein ETSY1_42585 [Candidatus Entotheonella factor]